MSSMLAFTGLQLIMTVAIFAICLLLMMIILIQKGRGGGLASAFGGGGGGGGGAFGAKTGDVFTGITVVLAGIYLLLTVFGNYVLRPDTSVLQNATVQPASGGGAAGPAGAPAPVPAGTAEQPATGAAGAGAAESAPVHIPEGSIKLNPNTANTSLGKAVEEGEAGAAATPPAEEGAAP
ncbi:MAG TPA: preprotein translocase subunit SecG, partial [Phycisphaerae bacterium]|nr:preprotein translocase subunit SecG [Phycisphaerae bacterium]